MNRWSLFVVAAVAATTPIGPAFAEPSVSCEANVCIVSVAEAAPTPVGPQVTSVGIIGPAGAVGYVGSSAWLADVASAFQGGTVSVTPSGATATADQVAGGPLDQWLVIGEQVAAKPDGTRVYTGLYTPGHWSHHDAAHVLVTTAPGGVSATGSAVHYEVLGETATTYGVTLAPDRASVKLNTYANGYVLPDGYQEGGIEVESTPEGTTVETVPDVP